MAVKVHFFFLLSEILNELSGGQVSFQILDVVLHNFGFVCNGEIEKVITKTKLEGFKFVWESQRVSQLLINVMNDSIISHGPKNDGSWGLEELKKGIL